MGHFYFVRHGQTIWNVEGKICGATDIALTQLGHEQAIETGKKILEEKIRADRSVFTSDAGCRLRARSDDAHIALENVQKLRAYIEFSSRGSPFRPA